MESPDFLSHTSPLTKIRMLSLIQSVTLVYPHMIFEHPSSIYVLLVVFCKALIKWLLYLDNLHNSCFKNFSVNFLSLKVIDSQYKVWKDQTRVILPVESSSDNPMSLCWSSHSESVLTVYQSPCLAFEKREHTWNHFSWGWNMRPSMRSSIKCPNWVNLKLAWTLWVRFWRHFYKFYHVRGKSLIGSERHFSVRNREVIAFICGHSF